MQGADAVGWHPYTYQPQPESVLQRRLLLRQVIDEAGLDPNPPLVNTESGYDEDLFGAVGSEEARDRQATALTRQILSQWSLGFDLITNYRYKDREGDAAGLVDLEGRANPALRAVQSLSEVAAGRTFTGLLPTRVSSLHALRLEGSDDVVIVLWSDRAGESIPLTVPAPASAEDARGRPLRLDPAEEDGRLRIAVRESRGPILLTFPR